MGTLGTILFMVGLISALVFFVLGIVALFKKNGKAKKRFLYFVASIIVFIVGGNMLPDSEPAVAQPEAAVEEAKKEDKEEKAKLEEEAAKKKAEEEAAKKKAAEEKAAKEKAEAEAKKKAEKEAAKKAEEEAEKAAAAAKELRAMDEQNMLNIFNESMGAIAKVTFDEENKAYMVLPTEEGFVREIAMTMSGTKSIDDWNMMVDQFVGTSEQLSENLGSDYKIAIVNPANKENVLLMVMDGVVVYDAFESGDF